MRQKLSFMTLITNTKLVFMLLLVSVPIWGKTLFPYCRTKRQKNHCFNMVHLRKISLAESRGSNMFFNNKEPKCLTDWATLANKDLETQNSCLNNRQEMLYGNQRYLIKKVNGETRTCNSLDRTQELSWLSYLGRSIY